jgi:hypothetical protein
MLKHICLGLTLLAGVPAWSQATSSTDTQQSPSSTDTAQTPQATDTTETPSATEAPMELPPPVTGQAYPSQVGSDVHHNYLNLAVSGSGGYIDNVLVGYTTKTSSSIFTLAPSVSYNKLTPRTTAQFNYTPAFTFYTQLSALNEIDENASGSLQYRFTPHFVFRMQDAFTKSSSVYGLPAPVLGGSVTGALPVQLEGLVASFADRISNTASVDLGLQTSENTMIGAEGTFAELDYPNSSQVPGLVNSNSIGGSGFYTRRVSEHQYLGFVYQYLQILSYLQNAEGEAALNTFTPFYSFYLVRTKQGNLTASVQGGLEHSSFIIRGGPLVAEWTPNVTASIGWQGPVTNFAVSYTRSVSGGGGLNGLYGQYSVSGTAQLKIARVWGVSAGANYSDITNDSTRYLSVTTGGHSIIGSVTGGRSLGRSVRLEAGYNRVHESYPGISAITDNPDSDRIYGSVSYQFTRPVGR